MRTNSMAVICGALIAMAIGTSSVWAARPKAVPQTPLTEAGQKLETRFADQLKKLRTELTAKVPRNDQAKADTLSKFLASDALDAKFAKYVVLLEATPQGLAEFAQQAKEQAALVDKMLADSDLMKQMLVADGANAKREGRGYGPAQYGQAMKIYTDIQKVSKKAATGVLQRLALAISLEHVVPIGQANPTAQTDAPATIDPVKRYLHYEKAYLDGELDPAFERLSTWELRMVDPTGPSQGTKSRFEYKVIVPRSGKYSLTARVVTANYDQRLIVSVNDADSEIAMGMPFTVGNWQDSKPVTLILEEGENTLRFWRNQPPQYGLAIKDFTLTQVK